VPDLALAQQAKGSSRILACLEVDAADADAWGHEP
jgi:hypothetical protein